MRLPNLLHSRGGRLWTFFILYVAEGMPQGFSNLVLATQLKRSGMPAAELGAMLGLVMLPWAFKWAYGPLIDVLVSHRFGPKRGWILATQSLMALSLLLLALVSPEQRFWFIALLLLHNLFAAMQDVAVDGLACVTLQKDERALGSGMMFAGQSLGVLVGGSGALMLSDAVGFQLLPALLALGLALITGLVVWPMREAPQIGGALRPVLHWRQVGGEIRRFSSQAFAAFMGSRRAFYGLFFVMLPISAMAMQLSLQSNLAVDLGLSNAELGQLSMFGSLITAASCVAGGWLSDRIERRLAVLVAVLLLSLPGLYLAWALQQSAWWPGQAAPADLVQSFWIACLAYSLCSGLIFGSRAALLMDLTRPAVAATQFAFYMALLNLSIAYSHSWQGEAMTQWGYATTLWVDALFGLSSLLMLPLLRARADDLAGAPARTRTRGFAVILGLLCLLWPLLQAIEPGAAAGPLLGLAYTLVFAVAGLFLLGCAGTLAPGALRRVLLLAALGLLLMLLRKQWQPALATLWLPAAAGLALLLPAIGGLALWGLGWHAGRLPIFNHSETLAPGLAT